MLKHVKNLESYSSNGVSRIWHTPYGKYYTRTSFLDMQPDLAEKFPLFLTFVNDEHCFGKYYRRRKNAELFSIEVILSGSIIFVQNGKKYHVKEKSLFFVHYDQDSEYTTGPEKHCHRLSCCINGKALNNLLYATKLIEHDVIKLNNFNEVKDNIHKCLLELKEKKAGFRKRASVLCYELLLKIEENLQQKNIPILLTKALDLMEHHLSQPLNVKKLSNSLNLSPSSLNRLFKENFKTTPINYFIGLKMKAAETMLINTSLQIQDIAYQLGYSTPLYFSSEFKKRTGYPPRQYRKKFIND